MGLITNIILWTSSLLIGTSGLVFGIIASINARKANKQIHSLISATWILQESEKLFFENIKEAINVNKKVIRKLNSKKTSLTFFEYSILSSPTRLSPLPKLTFNALKSSDYKDIAINYLKNKNYLDENFFQCFPNIEVLKSKKKMSLEKKSEILKYHEVVLNRLKSIIKEYSSIHLNVNNNFLEKNN